MKPPVTETTRLSSKGQIILPKLFRDSHNWRPGTEFEVRELHGSVLLTPLSPFPQTRPEDVFGCLAYKGKAKSIEQIRRAIAKGVRERHARGRY